MRAPMIDAAGARRSQPMGTSRSPPFATCRLQTRGALQPFFFFFFLPPTGGEDDEEEEKAVNLKPGRGGRGD